MGEDVTQLDAKFIVIDSAVRTHFVDERFEVFARFVEFVHKQRPCDGVFRLIQHPCNYTFEMPGQLHAAG